MIESVDKIKQSASKLSNSIHTAKPYYEARLYAQQVDDPNCYQILLLISFCVLVVQGISFSRGRSRKGQILSRSSQRNGLPCRAGVRREVHARHGLPGNAESRCQYVSRHRTYIGKERYLDFELFHTGRVNESQLECTDTKNMMKICDLKLEVANNRVTKLQSQLKSAIKASR